MDLGLETSETLKRMGWAKEEESTKAQKKNSQRSSETAIESFVMKAEGLQIFVFP